MDPTIKGTVDSLINGFSQYEMTNASLQDEVDQFCQKLRDFAESNNDVETFFGAYTDSGIPEEYTALISRVAMSSMGATNQDGSIKADYRDEPTKTEADLPSVAEFVEQYRPAYNEVCKGDNPRAKAAYEAIFEVANRTDDLIEAQIILERERLLWNIVRNGALDSLVPTLQKMDPLFRATTAKLIGQIAIFRKVNSDEELSYKIDLQEVRDVAIIADYTSKMHLTACLVTELIYYLNAKDDVYSWRKDILAQGGIKSMIKHRNYLRQILAYMKSYMGMSFEDIMKDEGLKIWMIKPRNIDEFGRKKIVMNPKYFDIYTDIINNEILADITSINALLRW